MRPKWQRMLKKIYRLTKHGSFGFVYRRGESKATAGFSLFYVKSASLKIGFSISNKLGKANRRNKLKRRMRAVVRELLPLKRYQIVIVARQNAAAFGFAQIKEQITELIDKAGLRSNEKKEA